MTQQPSSSSQDHRGHAPRTQQCYCGLTPVKYTCRKQGNNYMRQFYRCPREPQSQNQCHYFYFQWIQETKGEEYERMYASSQGSRKHPTTPTKSSVHYVEDFSSCGEQEEASVSPLNRAAKRSPKTSRSPPPPVCQHHWNRRGTNAHVKIRTCDKCGLQESCRRDKEHQVDQRYVDVTKMKKSGRPRALSP